MTTPEGKVKLRVKQILTAAGAYYFCPVQTGYGNRTLDFLVCYKGLFFGIETKRPGKVPTAIQHFVMRQISDAGGKAFVIDSAEKVEELKEYLKEL